MRHVPDRSQSRRSRRARSCPPETTTGQTEHPTRAHGATGRRRIWAARLGASETQVTWWSKLGRFAKIAERALPGWKAVDGGEQGSQLRRKLRTGCLGEAALLTVFADHLHAVADSPSQLELMLDTSGRAEIRLQGDEDGQVTPDESLIAYLLNGAIQMRRRKRNRLARAGRLVAARLGRGPARLAEQELRDGLAERGWLPIDTHDPCRGVQQAYVFALPELAQFFTVQAAALLGCGWEELEAELGVSQNVATIIVFSHRWLWPPEHLFDALDVLAHLAKARHGMTGKELEEHGTSRD